MRTNRTRTPKTGKTLRQLLLALMLLLGAHMHAQFTYTFTSTTGTYTQVSAGGSDLNAIEQDDAHSAAINLPFDFGYNGVPVSAIRVNSNGWISMDTGDNPNSTQGNDNSSFGNANGAVRPAICALWDDLDGAAGTARYETTGSAPNRVFTMEWRNWQWNYQSSVTISFQCKLYETTNVIEFIYRQESGGVNNGSGGASIGLLASASGTYISLNGTGATPTASTTTATTNLSTRPSTGRIYRFTPTGCTAPNITSVSSNSPICSGSTLNLTASATGTAPLSYSWTGSGTFSDNTVSNPTVTGAATGTYAVTVRNWCGTADTDNTSVTVVPAPTAANAGPDQTICLSQGSTTLAANTPVNGTGAWSILAGSPNTSTAQLSNIADPAATFSPTATGTYTLRWTISNSPCAASTNDVVITVNPFANAVSQTFNADGSFVVPDGVTQIQVQAWGGGASGGGSTNAGSFSARGGAGGGGGAYVTKTLTVTPGSTLNIDVADAVNGTTGANGTNGNASTIIGFEPQVFAAGGNAGAGNTSGGTPSGGAGGTTAGSQGDSEAAGSNGGNGATGVGVSSGAGGAAANGGGAGGPSISTGTSNGNNGTAPGGGGGGARTSTTGGSRAGGSGAAGRVIITYTPVAGITASINTICEGGSVTLTASGGGTYLWNTGATTAAITVSPSSSTTYTATVTNICPAQVSQSITVVPPSNAGTDGSITVCSLDPAFSLFAQLGGSPESGGTWSGPSPVSGGLYDPATMSPGVYTYTVSATSPCPDATATVTVTENAATLWYADADNDGFGDPAVSQSSCAAPGGYVSNNTDLCPTDESKQAPGQCGCGNPDTDTDNDGTADCNDLCPTDPNKTVPGICGCGVSDADTDNDGTVDCNDGCPNDPNKTVPGICGCGVSDVDTDSDGTADCNDGCPTDPVKTAPGACGCGVADTDTDLDGTADCNDGCPNDETKIAPGICGCDTPDDDTDSDGLADCVDPCPESANNADTDSDGTADCVDGCPNDPAKVNPGACGCGVADTDGDGDGAMDCMDGCPTDPNKVAPGVCGCGTADVDSDGDGALDCNDGCPNDPNKLSPGTCGCGAPEPGASCDDGDANTTNDVITGTCTCAGTPQVGMSSFALTTDNDAAATSWEIIPLGGGAPVCSGTGYANSTTVSASCMLPDGCYSLRVFDANMDGMCCINGMGGYVLRDPNNKRIIDAAGAGIFAGSAEVGAGFCLPLGPTGLTPSRCDREDYLPSDFIQAVPSAAVQAEYGVGGQSDDGYQFWIFNPNGGYSRRLLLTHASNNYQFPTGPDRCSYLKLSTIETNPVPHNMLLNVRVRTMVNGVYGPFGPACRMRIDLTNQCPTTQLMDNVNSAQHSCGLAGVMLNGGTTLFAQPVSAANRYQFEFSRPGYLRKISSPSSSLVLTNWSTLPLQYGHTYSVRVRVSFDGGATYCSFGPTCSLSTMNVPGSGRGMEQLERPAIQVRMWPNPNTDGRLQISLGGLHDGANRVVVEVHDLRGGVMQAEEQDVDGAESLMIMQLDAAVSPGVYLVRINANGIEHVEPLVVQ
ncbi:MAG: T9SS type A sorting domain-containing protein [Flavobacteriales bacterium]